MGIIRGEKAHTAQLPQDEIACRLGINRHHGHGYPTGFTLIEVIVAMGIFAVIAGIVFMCLHQTMQVSQESQNRIRMQQLGQLLIADIRSDLFEASNVGVSPDGLGLAISSPDASLYYFHDPEDRRLKLYCDEPGLPGRVSNLTPPRVEVADCAFLDLGSKIDVSISFWMGSGHDPHAINYRIAANVPVPNRDPKAKPGAGAPAGATGTGSRGADRGDTDPVYGHEH